MTLPSLEARNAAILVALAISVQALAQQETPPETPQPEATPPNAETPPKVETPPEHVKSGPAEAGVPRPEAEQPEYKGHPSEASVGGTERRSEYAGLFPHSPLSLVVPQVQKFEDWTSDNLRLDLGFRMAYFFQQASGGPGDRTAAAQDYRAYGTFHAWNWEEEDKGWAGNFYFRGEWRGEMFTKIPPAQLSSQIGTVHTTAYGQDEHDLALVQLYYEQFLFDGKLRTRIGKIDPDDYFNLGRWADDYRYFSNTTFSAFPAANHPSGGLGWNAQWYITPEWTVTGGMSDVQGRKTRAGFNTVDDGKFIYAADVTWSPKLGSCDLQGNYRLGVEYRDAVEDRNRPEDTTFYLNIDQEICKDVAPFLRLGYGTGRSTGIEGVVAVGLGIDNCFNNPGDAFGVGFGFDTPDEAIDTTRNAEYATEIFYRMQLTHAMQFTLGGQVIFDPLLAPDDAVVGIFEMRLVIDF